MHIAHIVEFYRHQAAQLKAVGNHLVGDGAAMYAEWLAYEM